MSGVELVRDLDPLVPGQERALYRLPTGEFVEVSTVADIGAEVGPTERAVIGLGGAMFGMATGGEETMAFPSSASGERIDSTEIAVANGPDSRELVLEQLDQLADSDEGAR
jgi:hypothetical protein